MRTFLALVLACLFAQSAYPQYIITKGATDKTVYIKIINETTGVPDTSIAYDTSGIDLEYVRAGAAAVDITEATQTASGAHSDGGFVHVGHGVYRLDLPDAAIASGVDSVEIEGTVTGMTVIGCTIQLVAADFQQALITAAGIQQECEDALAQYFATDTQSEPTDVPPDTPTLERAIMEIYATLCFKSEQTATEFSQYRADGTTKRYERTTSDDDTVFTKGEARTPD